MERKGDDSGWIQKCYFVSDNENVLKQIVVIIINKFQCISIKEVVALVMITNSIITTEFLKI